MIRGSEIIIAVRLSNQASGQARRLSRDIMAMGGAAKAANRMAEMSAAMDTQRLRSARLLNQFDQRRRQHAINMSQIDKQTSAQLTKRIGLYQRLNRTADPTRRLMLQRAINESLMEDDILRQRGLKLEQGMVAATAEHTAAMKGQEAILARMVEEQKLMAAMQRANRFTTVGRGVSQVSRAAGFGGLLATAGFAAVSKDYADFSTLVTKASTQIANNAGKGIDAILASVNRLEPAIQRQMKIFPASQNEMADALYQLYSSMDLTEQQGVKLLATTNKVSVAFGSDLPTATNVLITTLNNFGASAGGVNQTLDDLAAIVRIGRLELSDFDSMMNSVAPAAGAAGYNLKQMGGAMAVITRLIPSQERAATGLARLIDIFGNRDFQKGMAKAGVSITDVSGNLLGFEEIIRRIASLHPEGQGLQNFIQIMTASGRGRGQGITGQANARRALVQLVRHYQMLHRAQLDVNDSQGEFNQRFQAMLKSPGTQWAIFINQMRVLALEIGKDALPAIIRLQAFIKGLVDRWHSLSPELRHSIVYFTAITGVIALLAAPIGIITGSLLSLIGMLKLLSITLGTTGTAGVIGRLGLLLGILGRLTALGTILLAVKVVVDSSQLEDLRNWMKKNIPGGGGLVKVLGFSGRDLLHSIGIGGDPDEHGTQSKNANARKVDPLTKKVNEATQAYIKNLKANTLMSDIMKKYGAQLDGTDAKLKQYNEDMKQYNKGMMDAVKNAHTQYEQIVDQAVDNMIAKYNELRDANTAAFGSLFQGPLLTGESFQTAEEWGVTPTIGIINKDLSQQINAFNKWQGDLRAIAGRGAPKKLVQELTDLGPDAADKIEVLRKASPKMFNNFIRLWKQKNAAIERETKRDFNDQLKIWQSHGKNMGLKIIAGLESEGGALENTMRKILKNSFNGDLLSQIVAEAIRDFKANNDLPERPTGTRTGGTTTTRRTATPISQMTLAQVNKALKRDVPRLRDANSELISYAAYTTNPQSAGGTRQTDAEKAHIRELMRKRTLLERRVRRERRRRKKLTATANSGTSTTTQNTGMSSYQNTPSSPQQIQVNLYSKGEPTVVQARQAAWIIAQKSKRV